MASELTSDPKDDQTVLLCGGERALAIARMLRAPVIQNPPTLILLGPDAPPIPSDLKRTTSIRGDPTRRKVLFEAGVDRATTAVVLSDPKISQNPDASSLLIALAIEDLAPSIYTIVEVHDSNNIKHFDRTAVNETVCHSELSERLIAQAAQNHHISLVYSELITYQTDGNEIYKLPVKSEWPTFRAAFKELIGRRIIPVGVRRQGENQLNPPADAELVPGDFLWVVSLEQP
jgi:Trk K+ transport system NAD-binding subunit